MSIDEKKNQPIFQILHIMSARFLLELAIPEVSWFGHYIREWKDFPVLLEAWKQFFGIEVTFL